MISNLLRSSGYKVVVAPANVMEAMNDLRKLNNTTLLLKWLRDNEITRLGFSYRLDPSDACDYFCMLHHRLSDNHMLQEAGGPIRGLFFAGLPDACRLLHNIFSDSILYFPGDENPHESLQRIGVPDEKLPHDIVTEYVYDKARWDFAKNFIANKSYHGIKPPDHSGYPAFGTKHDSFTARLEYAAKTHTLPLIRAHAGPYNPDRLEAIKEFLSWSRQLAGAGLLDVLSIGSSQLTQSHFGEKWDELPNGGGVPVNSEVEYAMIREAARPMLVRTYAGTKNVPGLARIHERSLNISWHALSLWWFCEIDSRGTNTVLENLREHIETIRYISSTGKPLEPNIPHHFSFRGGDDITFIISAYIAAKLAKKLGITHLILQDMLNTPKYTCGPQDIAKGRVMLRLVRELEDGNFKVSLQTRAGLDYFSPDIEKAKVQLAAVTAMMDDIEPDNENSPEIIHVVSYSEAIRLATPDVINESIIITLAALKEYRQLKRSGLAKDIINDREINLRVADLYDEASEAIRYLEAQIPHLYSAEGLHFLFSNGFFPVPYMLDDENKYPMATKWPTALRNGGIRVIDHKGEPIRTIDRYKSIIQSL